MSTKTSEKGDISPVDIPRNPSIDGGKVEAGDDTFEVFKRGDGLTDFRTVGWVHASVVFLKRASSRYHPTARRGHD
jgi:hypothetical protein